MTVDMIADLFAMLGMLAVAAEFVDWLQSLVPDGCDVFAALADESRRIAREAEGPKE